MSDAFWISLPATLAAVTAAIIGILNTRKLTTMHSQINGRMGELLEVTARASKAEGVKEESDKQKS